MKRMFNAVTFDLGAQLHLDSAFPVPTRRSTSLLRALAERYDARCSRDNRNIHISGHPQFSPEVSAINPSSSSSSGDIAETTWARCGRLAVAAMAGGPGRVARVSDRRPPRRRTHTHTQAHPESPHTSGAHVPLPRVSTARSILRRRIPSSSSWLAVSLSRWTRDAAPLAARSARVIRTTGPPGERPTRGPRTCSLRGRGRERDCTHVVVAPFSAGRFLASFCLSFSRGGARLHHRPPYPDRPGD